MARRPRVPAVVAAVTAAAAGTAAAAANGTVVLLGNATEAAANGTMSTGEMIAEARARSGGVLQGGIVEFVEWVFVIVLVAPGTFPAMGCVILSCTSLWRRRVGGGGAGADAEEAVLSPGRAAPVGGAYQRVGEVRERKLEEVCVHREKDVS